MRGGYSPPLMIFRYLADKKSHGAHKYRQYCPSALRLILQVIFDSISYFRTTNRDTTDKSIFPPKISLVGLLRRGYFHRVHFVLGFSRIYIHRTFRNRPTAKRIGLRKPDSERFHIPKIQNRITGNRPDYRRHFPIPFTILPEMRILRKSVSAHPPSLSRGIHRT